MPGEWWTKSWGVVEGCTPVTGPHPVALKEEGMDAEIDTSRMCSGDIAVLEECEAGIRDRIRKARAQGYRAGLEEALEWAVSIQAYSTDFGVAIILTELGEALAHVKATGALPGEKADAG